jgi:hypothetical protein
VIPHLCERFRVDAIMLNVLKTREYIDEDNNGFLFV